MREIEFRGKSTYDNEWHYGYLIHDPSRELYKIQTNDVLSYYVTTESIGQYTGLTDRNGIKVFEGDIVVGDIPELIGNENLIGIVEYEESAFIVKFPNRQSWKIQRVGFCSYVNYKVIGNIHDNPELLEVDNAQN